MDGYFGIWITNGMMWIAAIQPDERNGAMEIMTGRKLHIDSHFMN
jgi:hypothetical protein